MQSGALRDWIDLERATSALDANGQAVETWAPLAEAPGMWAKVRYTKGGEAAAGPFVERGKIGATAFIPYRPDLDGDGAGLRVTWRGRVFDVRAVEWVGDAEALRLHMEAVS